MLTKMVMHLGDDVMVLCIEGCTSIVGFQEFVGQLLKVSKVNTMDKEKRPMPWQHNFKCIQLESSRLVTLSLASGHSYSLASCPSRPSL